MISQEYLMWFMRYGQTHLVIQDCIEDCYDLEIMLDDAEMHVFDQYGCLDRVEHLVSGIIDSDVWETGLEEYKEELKKEKEKERKNDTTPKLIGTILLAPPKDFRSKTTDTYKHYYVEDKMLDDYKTLRKHLGDRVSLIRYNAKDKT